MDGLTQTGATLGMSLIALQAGRALGTSLLSCDQIARFFMHPSSLFSRRSGLDAHAEPSDDLSKPASASRQSRSARPPSWLPPAFLLLGPVFWAATAILFGTYAPFRNVTFPMLLSPPGAVLRWYLAQQLNARFVSAPPRRSRLLPRWPMGTLAANLLASAVIAGVYTAQRVGVGAAGVVLRPDLHCQALYAVQEGFCGCLSTISTFAVELETLRPKRRAFAYLLFSWVVGVLLALLLVGVPSWTRGYEGRCAGITY